MLLGCRGWSEMVVGAVCDPPYSCVSKCYEPLSHSFSSGDTSGAARGLAYFHARGFVHGALSAATVLVEDRQPPKGRIFCGGLAGSSGDGSEGDVAALRALVWDTLTMDRSRCDAMVTTTFRDGYLEYEEGWPLAVVSGHAEDDKFIVAKQVRCGDDRKHVRTHTHTRTPIVVMRFACNLWVRTSTRCFRRPNRVNSLSFIISRCKQIGGRREGLVVKRFVKWRPTAPLPLSGQAPVVVRSGLGPLVREALWGGGTDADRIGFCLAGERIHPRKKYTSAHWEAQNGTLDLATGISDERLLALTGNGRSLAMCAAAGGHDRLVTALMNALIDLGREGEQVAAASDEDGRTGSLPLHVSWCARVSVWGERGLLDGLLSGLCFQTQAGPRSYVFSPLAVFDSIAVLCSPSPCGSGGRCGDRQGGA